jgi:hypothetical protein
MKTNWHQALFFILFLLVSGCAPALATAQPLPSTTQVSPTANSTPEPDCSAETTPDFSGYATWTKVNPQPIKGHEVFVNIYVDDLAKETYLSASGATFPVCARIVKTHLENANSDNITAITVMVKMPPGYDPDNHDWWWGMYDKDGRVAQMSGRVAVCIACHKPAAAADYVFSQKIRKESMK